MKELTRILILSPSAVYPPRSGGHSAILEPARCLARNGIEVTLFGYGIRRFEVFRHFRSFQRCIEPNLYEHRHISIWNLLDFFQRGRSGIPSISSAKFVLRSNPQALHHSFSRADVVQYESPWLFPYSPIKKPRILIAHNVEARLTEKNKRISKTVHNQIKKMERDAWQHADLVLCFTKEDQAGLFERYGAREAYVLPIGVDTAAFRPPTEQQRKDSRLKLNVEGKFVVLFTGSWHLPNRTALSMIETWSRQCTDPDILWVVAGSVGQSSKSRGNFIQTGEIPSLQDWFHSADCCINPMIAGSGMNVKMLEFLAYGLPAVSTPFGARGIDVQDGVHALIREVSDFLQAVALLKNNHDVRCRLAQNARRLIEEQYAWEVIGKKRLSLLKALVNSGEYHASECKSSR